MSTKVDAGKEARIKDILGAFDLEIGSTVSGVAYGGQFASDPYRSELPLAQGVSFSVD